LEYLTEQIKANDQVLESLYLTKELKESLNNSNITDHISNVKFEEKDLFDGDNHIWYGGEGSFDLYDVTFEIDHQCHVGSSDNHNNIWCSATRNSKYLNYNTICDIIINEFNLKLEDVLLIYQYIACSWTGGDVVSTMGFKSLFDN